MNEVLRQLKSICEAFIFDSSTISLLVSRSSTQYTILTVDKVRGQLRENSTLFLFMLQMHFKQKTDTQHWLYWLERGKTLYIMLQHILKVISLEWNLTIRVRFSSRFLLHTETNYHRYINETLLSCFVFEPEREIISAAGWLLSGTSDRITKTPPERKKEVKTRNSQKTDLLASIRRHFMLPWGLLFTNLLN